MEHLIWPGAFVAVALVLGVVIIFVCRGEIRALIGRITRIDKSGITAASQEVAKVEPPAKDVLDSKEFMEASFTEIVRQQEAIIKDQMNRIRFEDPAQREPLLVRALAQTQVNAKFDRINMIIYGSQLDLLMAANAAPAGISEETVRKRFESEKEADTQFYQPINCETYLGFLINSGLLVRDANMLRITMFGKEFMKFLVNGGFTYPRRG